MTIWGHMGIARTLGRVQKRFCWPHMSSSQSYISSCNECIESKTSCTKGQVPLKPMVISKPFTFWAIDYMTSLPETDRRNKLIALVGEHATKHFEIYPRTFE